MRLQHLFLMGEDWQPLPRELGQCVSFSPCCTDAVRGGEAGASRKALQAMSTLVWQQNRGGSCRINPK